MMMMMMMMMMIHFSQPQLVFIYLLLHVTSGLSSKQIATRRKRLLRDVPFKPVVCRVSTQHSLEIDSQK